MISKKSINEFKIKLTPYAKVFYLEWTLDPGGHKYNMLSADQVLYGQFDIPRLQAALIRYIEDHVILNSHIELYHDEPYWVKNSSIHELEICTEPCSEKDLLAYVQKPFDVYQCPLYRFKLIKLSENTHRLMVVFHHLVMDGMSLNSGIIDTISNYYNDPNFTIEHNIQTQIELITALEQKLSAEINQNKEAYLNFWKQQLSNLEMIHLRFLEAPSTQSSSSDTAPINPISEIKFGFDSAIFEKLKRVTRRHRITPFIYSQSIFAMLLHQYTQQRHFALGYSIAIKEGMHFIYGSQVNINLIPIHLESDTTPIKLFHQVRNFFLTTLKGETRYGYCPTYDILSTVNNNKKLLEAFFAQAPFRSKPFTFSGIEKTESYVHWLNVDGVEKGIPVFDQEETPDQLNFRFRYEWASINQTLLEAFLNGYKKLFIDVLNDLLENQDSKVIGDYSCLSHEQYQQWVYGFNQALECHSYTQTIHKQFEAQVASTPHRIAVVYEDKQLTYQELNQKANRLAHHIQRNFSIQPEDKIALCMPKTELTIVAILAILKCGAAYVPIASNYPQERIQYILKDSGAKLVIVVANDEFISPGLFDPLPFVKVDDHSSFNDLTPESEERNPNVPVNGQHLAYVIYTSGTTGQPKGVLQQHDSVLDLFESTKKCYSFGAEDVWVLFHSHVFDFTVWEMWGALFHGGKLIIPTHQQTMDFETLYSLCQVTGVTVLNQTPSAFYKFSEIMLKNNHQPLNSLRYVMLGGEKVNFMALTSWFSSIYREKTKLVNWYGVTELTVISTHKKISPKDLGEHCLIGKMRPSQSSYVLGADLSVMPLGAIGELYVGGNGLARGYLNQPALTQQRFIPNPFQTKEEKSQGKNSRLYKTGDLVKRLPDGSLEYIDRNDTQLKIRGYRIEAGEIESLLCHYPGIKQAVALVVNVQSSLNPTVNCSPCFVQSSQDSQTVFENPRSQPHLSPIQAWFFSQDFSHPNHWNQSFLIKTPSLDVDLLKASIAQLIQEHECFTIRFSSTSGTIHPFQTDRALQKITLQMLDLRNIPHPEGSPEFHDHLFKILTDWQSHFDLAEGTLYTFGYIQGYSDGSTRIYFALHHLIVDWVSAQIIVHELHKNYHRLASGNSKFPSTDQKMKLNGRTSYSRWINEINSYAKAHPSERNYWLQMQSGCSTLNEQLQKLVHSHAHTQKPEKSSRHLFSFQLSHKETDLLLRLNQFPLSLKIHDILMAAFVVALKKLFIQVFPDFQRTDSIHVTLESHGRADINPQMNISQTIGWFTSLYPCQFTFDESDLLNTFYQIKKILDSVPNQGIGYGAFFEYAKTLPLINFNYLGKINHQEKTVFWEITAESSGQSVDTANQNPNVIEVLIWLVNGRLEYRFYSQLNQAHTHQLAQDFTNQLNQLANLLSSPHERKDALSSQEISSFQRLVAYYVADKKLDQAQIRDYLSKQLPQYSVPQQLIPLDSIPLTINGKIDTQALSQLKTEDHHSQKTPRNEKETLIIEAFAKILHHQQIELDDDFFVIGGDSISAITLTLYLRDHLDIHVRDIFRHRTPRQLAQHLAFSNHSVQNKLLAILQEYEKQEKTVPNKSITLNQQVENYLSSSRALSVDLSLKKIKQVLLTGATGFLGCNLLHQLLTETNYSIILLIRADSDQKALDRIHQKYQRYFPHSPFKIGRDNPRVSVVCGDLEKEDLGLQKSVYTQFTKSIDSIIHTAALVKQVGDEHEFYKANVLATIHLLTFCQLTHLKDFHYISTASLLENNAETFRQWENYCTEEQLPENLNPMENNVYLKSKWQAENEVVRFRQQGIQTNLYRVGNLAFISENSIVQENVNTLVFTQWLEYFIKSKVVPSDTKLYLSPVDLTANAIVKLFDKRYAINKIFHVFNMHPFDLVEYLQHDAELPFKIMTTPEFIRHLLNELASEAHADKVMPFLLAQGWLGVDGIHQFSQKIYLQNKTEAILKQLGFEWSAITENQFKNYLSQIQREI